MGGAEVRRENTTNTQYSAPFPTISATGGDININGLSPTHIMITYTGNIISSGGGNSFYGIGGKSSGGAHNGRSGGSGSGGSSGLNQNTAGSGTTPATNGGNGGDGFVKIWEYA